MKELQWPYDQFSRAGELTTGECTGGCPLDEITTAEAMSRGQFELLNARLYVLQPAGEAPRALAVVFNDSRGLGAEQVFANWHQGVRLTYGSLRWYAEYVVYAAGGDRVEDFRWGLVSIDKHLGQSGIGNEAAAQ